MTVSRVKSLESDWAKKNVFRYIEKSLDEIGFTDTYVDRVLRRNSSKTSKVIKDNIWGMIEVDAASIRILDCPIFQRMRWIKQLGMTYLTYPSAEHSRFIHSLGMYSVISRFIEVSDRSDIDQVFSSPDLEKWRPTEDQRRLLKHTALLHDSGHMPFSHVTESIMHSDQNTFTCGDVSVDDFLFDAQDHLGKNLKLAECISLAIVLSPRFQTFYCKYVEPNSDPSDPHRMAALISGLQPDAGLTGLAGIISGPAIDADKIDYIQRDAAACGIPVGIDVARLFFRSSFIHASPAALQVLRREPTQPKHGEKIFVVNASGLDSIEEVGLARTTLYHRVYLHQTTRNAERVLAKTIKLASQSDTSPEFLDAFKMWAMNDSFLLAKLAKHSSDDVRALSEKISMRDLPKRSCAFGRSFTQPLFPMESVFPRMQEKDARLIRKQIIGTVLEVLGASKLLGEPQRELEQEILDETIKLIGILNDLKVSGLDLSEPSIISVLPMTNVELPRSDCTILESGRLVSSSSRSITDEQMEAVDIIKSVGYVMSDAPCREIVFIAARKVLYARSKRRSAASASPVRATLNPYLGTKVTVAIEQRLLLSEADVIRRIGLSSIRIADISRSVGKTDYFNEFPRLLGLSDQDAQAASAISERFQDFEGQGGWKVTEGSISKFISQFPSHLRREMLVQLEQFRVLDRSSIVRLICSGLAKVDAPSGRKYVTGFSPDSGNVVRTFVEHDASRELTKDGWTFKKTIREVLSEATIEDTIVLVDDNATSGSQALTQFMAWIGADKALWSDEQKRERGIEAAALDARDAKKLQSMSIYFVTALGTERAQIKLESELPQIGIAGFKKHLFSEHMNKSNAISAELSTFLAQVGAEAIAWSRYESKDFGKLSTEETDDCRSNSLGYDNAQALVSTLMNVPVGTFTALWCPGYFRGDPWFPLFLRRGYIDRLVIG